MSLRCIATTPLHLPVLCRHFPPALLPIYISGACVNVDYIEFFSKLHSPSILYNTLSLKNIHNIILTIRCVIDM